MDGCNIYFNRDWDPSALLNHAYRRSLREVRQATNIGAIAYRKGRIPRQRICQLNGIVCPVTAHVTRQGNLGHLKSISREKQVVPA